MTASDFPHAAGCSEPTPDFVAGEFDPEGWFHDDLGRCSECGVRARARYRFSGYIVEGEETGR